MQRDNIAAMLSRILVAQHTFNHELLFRLVESKILSQSDAVAIAAKTAETIRGLPPSQAADQFVEALARGFETIAARIAGLPPIHDPKP